MHIIDFFTAKTKNIWQHILLMKHKLYPDQEKTHMATHWLRMKLSLSGGNTTGTLDLSVSSSLLPPRYKKLNFFSSKTSLKDECLIQFCESYSFLRRCLQFPEVITLSVQDGNGLQTTIPHTYILSCFLSSLTWLYGTEK